MGVNVVTNRHGYLRFRIFWKGRDVVVSTRYRDDGPGGRNRKLVSAKALLIEERLREGAQLHRALLEVLGDCPPRLMPSQPARAASSLTFADLIPAHLERLRALERKSYVRKADACLKNVIKPFWGALRLADATSARLAEFQAEILARTVTRRDAETGELESRPIKQKTARNIITCHFRRLILDAIEIYGVPDPDPFSREIRWPKKRGREVLDNAAEPDPFTAKNRDAILEWYLRENRFWYPFLFFQFWTGCRPSETIALREADVDLVEGTARITKSRDEGEESEPKTRKSRRTIHLYPNVLEVLRELRPSRMHPRPDDYFFTDEKGGPVYARDWPVDHGFYDVLRRLNVRQRKFYATRHTFISWAITQGANPFGVAAYCGTSVQMIETRYAKWIPDKGLDPALLKALAGAENRTPDRTPMPKISASVVASGAYRVRGGGLEPPRVLPH